MGPVQNNLVTRFERGNLLQDGGILENGLVIRIYVNHQLFLLLIAIFARLPVIQVLDDPEGGEVLGMGAFVRAQGSPEHALSVNDARELGFRHMVGKQFPGRKRRLRRIGGRRRNGHRIFHGMGDQPTNQKKAKDGNILNHASMLKHPSNESQAEAPPSPACVRINFRMGQAEEQLQDLEKDSALYVRLSKQTGRRLMISSRQCSLHRKVPQYS